MLYLNTILGTIVMTNEIINAYIEQSPYVSKTSIVKASITVVKLKLS